MCLPAPSFTDTLWKIKKGSSKKGVEESRSYERIPTNPVFCQETCVDTGLTYQFKM